MQAMAYEPTVPQHMSAVAPPTLQPAMKQEPTNLTGSVGMPKTPTGRRPSLDLEYELFRDSGGQVPELSQPGKPGAQAPLSLTDSFPASHEFLLDLHGGAVTPPMRSPGSISVPAPFQGARGSFSQGPPHPLIEPRLVAPSSFAFPPQPHTAPLTGSASIPDSGASSAASGAFRPQTRLASVPPTIRIPNLPNPPAKGAAAQTNPYSSFPSSPEPAPRKKSMPAEEKARVRAEQSRTSSRLYRLRKKAYQQSLEGTVDNMKAENSQLRKELEAAKETISKLQNEVASLKENKG